jgi:hypothetical protein
MIDHIQQSIDNAINHISKLNSEILSIEGMSSSKIRHFLNNVVDIPNAKYLEIGTWAGSTLCSALYKNNPDLAIAIDNFSQFGSKKDTFYSNIAKYIHNGIQFYDTDCFQFDKSIVSDKINIYLYDGDHSENSHELALSYFIDILDNNFIYLCDDWNFTEVKSGTIKAINNLNISVKKEWIMPASYNGDKQSWWNGFYIALISKN